MNESGQELSVCVAPISLYDVLQWDYGLIHIIAAIVIILSSTWRRNKPFKTCKNVRRQLRQDVSSQDVNDVINKLSDLNIGQIARQVPSNQSWLHDVEKLYHLINNSLNVSTPSLTNRLLWPSKLNHQHSLNVTMTTVSAPRTNQIAAEFEKDEFMEWEEEGGTIHDMMSSLHHRETSKTPTLSLFRRIL